MTEREISLDVQKLAESLGPLPTASSTAALIVVSGLPGTGKSYVTARLAERLPLLVLESDALRKSLFPLPDYTEEESARLFRAIHRLMGRLLGEGISLVLDATNLSEFHRRQLYRIAHRFKARLIIARVHAPSRLVKERLEARAAGTPRGNHSEADWDVYLKLKPTVDVIRRPHFVVNTARDIEPVLDKIVKEFKGKGR